MTRYHLKDNGDPAVCNADVEPCPKGDVEHIETDDYQEALAFAEAKNKELYEQSSASLSVSKKPESAEITAETVAQMSDEEVEKALEERVSSPVMMDLIAKRDAAREAFQDAKAKSKKLAAAYYRNKIENNHTKFRKARFIERDAYYDFIDTNKDLSDYKDQTALLAARLSESAFEQEWEGDELGNVVKTVEFPSGSREWLEQRQLGIGGSDAGAIFKVDPEWGSLNYSQVWDSKVKPITDEEVAEQEENNSGFSGAAGRGNAWEPLIAKRFAEENPGYELLHSKSSWVNKDRPWQFANFDGILKDKETGEMGILEIKTASDASKWENGVPLGYKSQVLHYLDATGFDYAHVAVSIDDHDYRSYRINKDDPVVPGDDRTYADRRQELEDFFSDAQAKKAKGPKDKASQKSDFTYSETKRKDTVVKELAAFRQEDPDAVRKRLDKKMEAEDADADAIIREEYASFDPSTRTKDTVSIDLETSSGSPARGEIIEVGIVRTNAKGEVVDRYQALFDIDDRAKRVNGTGEQDVHNIGVEDIEGKQRFDSPEVQKRMQEIMGLDKGDTVMLAHNAGFEKRWLSQNLDGFHKAQLPTIDTMRLARQFDHHTKDNTLSEFAPAHGVPYENAHRAYDDAAMTQKAYENFLADLTGKKNKK